MDMSKFDFAIFGGEGNNDEFIVHAKKFTREQADELFRKELSDYPLPEPESKLNISSRFLNIVIMTVTVDAILHAKKTQEVRFLFLRI
jgi:hypothetical protein